MNLKNNLVVKSNNLVEAFCVMTQNECKIISYLISKIMKDDKDFGIQRISVREFNDLLEIRGSKTNSYMKVFEKELLKKMVEVEYENGDRLNVNWFQYSKYIHSQSTLELCFNSYLKEHLLELNKNYTKYSLKVIARLDSSYSIRIYELLKQYEKIGYREITIQELKYMVGANDKYKLYADFKKYVIFASQKSLKKNADIYFEFDEIKYGKKVEAIKFFIFKNTANGKYDNQIESNHIQDTEDMPSEEVQKISPFSLKIE